MMPSIWPGKAISYSPPPTVFPGELCGSWKLMRLCCHIVVCFQGQGDQHDISSEDHQVTRVIYSTIQIIYYQVPVSGERLRPLGVSSYIIYYQVPVSGERLHPLGVSSQESQLLYPHVRPWTGIRGATGGFSL